MILNLCVGNFVFDMVVVFQLILRKICYNRGIKTKRIWMFGGIVKIFDLFVIGDYLALDFVNNFTNGLKDFLSGLYTAVECSLLKHALELRASKNLCDQK